MPRPEQYRRISHRYALAADRTMPDIPEASGFCAYHAFESIGGAWIRHCGQQVPVPHVDKLRRFVTLSRGQSFEHEAGGLEILLKSLRNQLLYPIADGSGGYALPETKLSARDAADLLRRVRRLIRQVSRSL